jgi:hypothetical protein
MLSIEPLLDSAAVERIIGIGSGTGAALDIARHRKRINIPYIRVGHKIRYRRSAVEQWLEARTVTPEARPEPNRIARKKRGVHGVQEFRNKKGRGQGGPKKKESKQCLRYKNESTPSILKPMSNVRANFAGKNLPVSVRNFWTLTP